MSQPFKLHKPAHRKQSAYQQASFLMAEHFEATNFFKCVYIYVNQQATVNKRRGRVSLAIFMKSRSCASGKAISRPKDNAFRETHGLRTVLIKFHKLTAFRSSGVESTEQIQSAATSNDIGVSFNDDGKEI